MFWANSTKQKLGKQKAEIEKSKAETLKYGKLKYISVFCFLNFCFCPASGTSGRWNGRLLTLFEEKQKLGKQKIEMNSRLPDDFRDRAKRYAASMIRLFVKLPKQREKVRILGK